MFKILLRLSLYFISACILFASSASGVMGQENCSSNITHSATAISYDHDCFKINGQDIYLYSGSVHYHRCPKPLWKDRLEKIKAAGFNTVQFYVPWNYHEKTYGQADFSKLDEFLNLCHEMQLYVIIRIGPFICGEWDNGGFPEWLIAKGIRNSSLRTNEAKYVEYVNHWYKQVVPVIKKHLVTKGGNVILLQVENEYGGGAYHKREVLRDRYLMVTKLGIDVPIVTCNTPYAWDNSEPVMSKIINGNNSTIVRWKNIDVFERRVNEAREQEYNAPTIVLEMPGGQGMHSNFVGYKAAALDERDYVAITKTALMNGVGLTNYYMLYGGTNLGYGGASYQCTSYCVKSPVKCPILEPGGLGESYYAVKCIGQWLEKFGVEQVHSKQLLNGTSVVESTGSSFPKIIEKVNGDMAFIFIRDEADEDQKFKLSYTDPITKQQITIPQNGYITLSARDMQILTCNIPLGDVLMKYSTSEILTTGRLKEMYTVVLYGAEGRQGEVSFVCGSLPDVQGTSNFIWDEVTKTLTLNYTHSKNDNYILIDDVELLIISKKRAAGTWTLDVDENKLPLISDVYFLRDYKVSSDSLSIDLEIKPVGSDLTLMLPSEPKSIEVDGREHPFVWDKQARWISFDLKVGTLPDVSVLFDKVKFTKENLSKAYKWMNTDLRPLEFQGILDKGYIRYRAEFESDNAKYMIIRFYEGSSKSGQSRQTVGDPVMVLINGRYVPEASGWHPRKIKFDVSEYLRQGRNEIQVILEKIGRPCGAGGWGMNEPKGLAAVSLMDDSDEPQVKILNGWQLAVGLNGQQEKFFDRNYDDSSWQIVELGEWQKKADCSRDHDGIGWYRLKFNLDMPENWIIPLKFTLSAKIDALIYLNGEIVGRYIDVGGQREFYLPECWLNTEGENVITLAVRGNRQEGGLHEASVLPYKEFSVQKKSINIKY